MSWSFYGCQIIHNVVGEYCIIPYMMQLYEHTLGMQFWGSCKNGHDAHWGSCKNGPKMPKK